MLEDPDVRTLEAALDSFSLLANDLCFSLIYFAGHGFEANGAGYVLPADFPLPPRASILRQYALPITRLLTSMRTGLGPKVLVLDACRTGFDRWNAEEWARIAPDLQMMRESENCEDVLIAYSTSAGDIARDGVETNSLYCVSFCKNVAIHELSLEDCFKEIGLAVMASTARRQRPWYYSNLGRPVRFSDLPRFQLVQSFLIPGSATGAVLTLSGGPTQPNLLACAGTTNVYRVASPSVSIEASVKNGIVVAAAALSNGGLALIDQDAVLSVSFGDSFVSVKTTCRGPFGIRVSSDDAIIAIYGIDSFSVFAIDQTGLRCLLNRKTGWSPFFSLFVDTETIWVGGSGGHVVEVSQLKQAPKTRRINCSPYRHIYSGTLCTHTAEVALTTNRGEIAMYGVKSRKLHRQIELPTIVQTAAARRDSLLNSASNNIIQAFLFSPELLSEEERDFCLENVAWNELLFASCSQDSPILAVSSNEGLVYMIDLRDGQIFQTLDPTGGRALSSHGLCFTKGDVLGVLNADSVVSLYAASLPPSSAVVI